MRVAGIIAQAPTGRCRETGFAGILRRLAMTDSSHDLGKLHIDRDAPDYTPREPGLPRMLARLKARQPVTIVTMGDSLSDKRHWANRDKLWSEELVKKLKTAYGGEVRLVNPAIGGTTLSQNVILMPRWLREAPAPDLVVIWFGGNDWDTGVRGARYKEYLEMAVDRVRRATKGQAEVLLMTACPSFAAWQTRNELCVAACEVAKERKTGFVDAATAFHKAGTPAEALRRQYWAWDKVHLGSGGHGLIAEIVFAAIASPHWQSRQTSGAGFPPGMSMRGRALSMAVTGANVARIFW